MKTKMWWGIIANIKAQSQKQSQKEYYKWITKFYTSKN